MEKVVERMLRDEARQARESEMPAQKFVESSDLVGKSQEMHKFCPKCDYFSHFWRFHFHFHLRMRVKNLYRCPGLSRRPIFSLYCDLLKHTSSRT